MKCRQWESNTFTVSDYSFSISPASRAMDIATERRGIELFCSCKLILVIHVFLALFNYQITFIDCRVPKDICNVRLVHT